MPSHGSSSGPVPAALPRARPTRSIAELVASDSVGSFSALWISAAVQPASATLTATSR